MKGFHANGCKRLSEVFRKSMELRHGILVPEANGSDSSAGFCSFKSFKSQGAPNCSIAGKARLVAINADKAWAKSAWHAAFDLTVQPEATRLCFQMLGSLLSFGRNSHKSS